MKIRPLEASDLTELLDLYDHLHNTDDPRPDKAIVQAIWDELLLSRHFKYFGAFDDTLMISSCTLSVIPNLTRGCRPYGVIENVVTHAKFRQRGLGRMILAHALDVAWSEGCYKVMLMTGRKDEATFRFYEGAGFDRHAKQAFIANNRG